MSRICLRLPGAVCTGKAPGEPANVAHWSQYTLHIPVPAAPPDSPESPRAAHGSRGAGLGQGRLMTGKTRGLPALRRCPSRRRRPAICRRHAVQHGDLHVRSQHATRWPPRAAGARSRRASLSPSPCRLCTAVRAEWLGFFRYRSHDQITGAALSAPG